MHMQENQGIDKTRVSITTLETCDTVNDWAGKSPLERLAGLETLRQQWNRDDTATERLQRVYTVLERPRR